MNKTTMPTSRIEFRSLLLSDISDIQPSSDVTISGVCDDSRQIQPGDAFLCMPRTATDAELFTRKAMENGATAVITVAKSLNTDLPLLQLPDMDAVGKMLRKLLGTESFNIDCVGITGTDGKTSVAWMLREALSRHFDLAWSTGTLGLVRGDSDISDIGNTTPSLMTSHQLMQCAMKEGVDALVMEVSSHGIEQKRIAALPMNTAIWTNLGHDHLQDHGGFDSYATLKESFIIQTVEQGGIAICNADDKTIRKLMARSHTATHWYAHGLYSNQSNNQAANESAGDNIDLTWEQELPGMVRFSYQGEEIRIEDIPVGEFHAENLAAVALTLMVRFNVKFEDLSKILDGISTPPGRMQSLDIGRWQVFIDYAHTPEALSRCLETARNLARNRLMVVFGCGGNRDREKRPEMGHAAVTMADVVWITSDNPRNEAPELIASEIENGMPKPYPADVSLELDRKQAINQAIDAMLPGDLLVIAGKGHEAYMEIEDHRFEWSDFDIAVDALHDKEDRRMRLCA
ncbi:MAG: UDP-N-acetylmuramoyl-L-alanyl-D-glutamate--2,6-diaminopimelate ligase [Mariprofundaceae bacterium]